MFIAEARLRKSRAGTRCVLLLAALACTQCTPHSAPLMDYVTRPDASYAWQRYGHITYDGTDVFELRLHSQTWQNVLWKHRLLLIRPEHMRHPGQGLLALGGGRWRPEYDVVPDHYTPGKDAELFIGLAEELQSVVIVLDLVPFQPLFGLTEDELIAHTLEQYLETGDPDWPLLLPMVKSAVRAMDTAQEFAASEWDLDIADFTVIGGSKRGWTAWLTAAVDPRVNALAPIVIDALNMREHFPHQTEAWGQPSESIKPYTKRNLDKILASDEGNALRDIIDPYSYRKMLLQPKLIINATNDEYFPVDSINLYWAGLEGPKYSLYVPNQAHDVEDFERVIASVGALHEQAGGGELLPHLEWTYKEDGSSIGLCVRSDVEAERIVVWSAESEDRDFRDEAWKPREMDYVQGGYSYESPRPDSGYLALVAEAVFDRDDRTFSLSTTPAIVAAAGAASGGESMISEGRNCFAN